MVVKSDVTGITYDDMDAVFYRNCVQIGWMLSHPDVIVLDVFSDSQNKLVMVFDKESHRRYIGEWAERKNKEED